MGCSWFQSSPALSGRCNVFCSEGALEIGTRFQSSPALSGRCNQVNPVGRSAEVSVSILTGPFGPVQHLPVLCPDRLEEVSILTGPFGPVQLGWCAGRFACRRSFNPHRPFRAGATPTGPAQAGPGQHPVSILTGPFGPVQRPGRPSPPSRRPRFNPHRPFRAGATRRSLVPQAQDDFQFQSSPALSGRCNGPAHLPHDAPRRFNPHRPFRAGATGPARRRPAGGWSFNPHRPFRAGATLGGLQVRGADQGFNPHRPFRAGATSCRRPGPRCPPWFQSSPALSGRCNSRGIGAIQVAPSCFNPHRPFRAGATCLLRPVRRANGGFNPHRPFRAGATKWKSGRR